MSIKIAIIGAGPAGCVLARLLQQASISVTVFEAEESIDFRSQGGTLDLHEATGQAALKEAGLHGKFLEKARFDGESLVLCDKRLIRYVNFAAAEQGSRRGAPEIDRAELRKILLESLDQDSIRWNHKLKAVDEDGGLHFEHGTEKGFDLVIGADGAWSKVRNALSDQKPSYTGVAGYSLSIPNAQETAPETYKFVNRGTVFSHSDGKGLTAQQLNDKTIHISFWSVRAENWQEDCGYDVHDSVAVKRAIKAEIEDWDPTLKRMIDEAGDDVSPRSLYMLPVGFTWKSRKGITLLGDAAHLMAPFAGEGVNLAFEDARQLAKAIVDASEDGSSREALYNHVADYETNLFERAKKAQEMTDSMTRAMLFTDGAPRSSVESWILAKIAYELPSYLYPLCVVGVHSYYFFFKLFVR